MSEFEAIRDQEIRNLGNARHESGTSQFYTAKIEVCEGDLIKFYRRYVHHMRGNNSCGACAVCGDCPNNFEGGPDLHNNQWVENCYQRLQLYFRTGR